MTAPTFDDLVKACNPAGALPESQVLLPADAMRAWLTARDSESAYRRIAGYCPMGCGRTLFLADGSYPTCSWFACPCPDAVSTILEDREHEHIVELRAGAYTLRHPLRERLDDALMTCTLGAYLEQLAGPPLRLGRYRVVPPVANPEPAHWRTATWQELPGADAEAVSRG